MRELRYAGRWQAVGLLLVVMTLVALLAPSQGRLTAINDLDKFAHVLGFFGLTLWFTGIYRRQHYAWLGIAMLVFGGVTELLQESLSRSRSGDVMDLLADAIGIALAIATALLGGERWCELVERRLP